MARFSIETQDFKLEFTSTKFADSCKSALRTLGAGPLHSDYIVRGEPVLSCKLEDAAIEGFAPTSDDPRVSHFPFFFDNTDYDVWVDFGTEVSRARLVHESKAVETELAAHALGGRHILSGKINFGNDVGKDDFTLSYFVGGVAKTFALTFHVLSSKLDYHGDWPQLIAEIEHEYRLLSFDCLRRTYHSFDRQPEGDTSDLIWWNLFKAEEDGLIRACKLILNRPRRRLTRRVEYLRAEQLTYLSPQTENEFLEHQNEPERLYRVERYDMTNDTPENRFFKHALKTIAVKHRRLGEYLKGIPDLSESERGKIVEMDTAFRRMLANPFFRGVGPYKGMKQTSMVLQQAPGYAAIARIYAILKAAYAIHEGLLKLQTKSIDRLYEIWCFLTVKEIVKNSFEPDVDVSFNYPSLHGKFVKNLQTGTKSRVVFRAADGTELAEVAYNPKAEEQGDHGIDENTRIVTGVTAGAHERPDIVLRLTKPVGGEKDFKLTYLFDAKYRIEGRYVTRGISTVDYPPQDAIDQLHRYRDAIYYQQKMMDGSAKLKKEVIGGYVLFPGNGDPLEVQKARFMESRKAVNIGAFPLKPGDSQNRAYLESFIKELLENENGMEQVLGVKTQKGTEAVPDGCADPANVVQIVRYEGGLSKDLLIREKVFPCEQEICANPEKVKLLVFPHVKGGEAFVPTGSFVGPIDVAHFKRRFPAFVDLKFATGNIYYWPVKYQEMC